MLLFCVAVFSACSGDGPNRDSFTARDSVGIHIVENTAPAWGVADAWRLSEQPLVDIGGLEGDPDYELYRVTSALRLPDGRIVIGNSGTNEMRFYDESGIHLLDAGSGRYNEPFLGEGLRLLPGYARMQGVVTRADDPRETAQLLADPTLRMVNRNRGAGTADAVANWRLVFHLGQVEGSK